MTADTRVAQALIPTRLPKRQLQVGEDDGNPGQPHQVGGCRLPESCETWGIGGPGSWWVGGLSHVALPLTENKHDQDFIKTAIRIMSKHTSQTGLYDAGGLNEL